MGQKSPKPELRQEICELRHVGSQMANACYNLGQGQPVRDQRLLLELARQRDAIKRREKP